MSVNRGTRKRNGEMFMCWSKSQQKLGWTTEPHNSWINFTDVMLSEKQYTKEQIQYDFLNMKFQNKSHSGW